ncbi:MAG: hypothetical protein IPK63_18330 [Candidatus Competibacteraceae bacterium]|nr:hypothetical protein [Candidatus Competibacteraceae bacterium]
MPSYYGNLVDDATKRRLNTEAVQSFDTGLKRLTSNSRPVISNAYGVGSLPTPAGGGIPSSYMPKSFPQRTPQSNPLGFLNNTGQVGLRLGRRASLPTPDFIAGNPGYATQTQSLSQGYNNALGNDVYAKGSTLTPGSAEYQNAMRDRLGGQFAGGSNPLYSRQYMAPKRNRFRYFWIAPGQGTVSVRDQGNGGTVEGMSPRSTDRPLRYKTSIKRGSTIPMWGASASARMGYVGVSIPWMSPAAEPIPLGTLLPDVSRARTSQQLQLAEMAQRANALQLQDSATRSGQQLTANTARANTLADLFKQQQQSGLEQQRLGVDQQKINADTALRTSEQQQKWAQNTFENTF